MGPVIITAALVGAEVLPGTTPHLPLTPDEIAADAAAAVAAGASIVHLHVRDADGRPTQDAATFEAAILAIRGADRRHRPGLDRAGRWA